MSLHRVTVRREKRFTPGIFSPDHWWGVWLTPFQQVASFTSREDALNWAGLIVVLNRRRGRHDNGATRADGPPDG